MNHDRISIGADRDIWVPDRRATRVVRDDTVRRRSLPRHLAVAEQEVARLRQRLVALEAGGELGVRIRLLRRREGLIFPLAVADIVRIFGAPALALLHHGVADDVGLDEAAVGVLLGVAV